MSSRVLYLLACLASVVLAAYADKLLQPKVNGIEQQCRDAGHKGACYDLNYDFHGLKCWDIICKRTVPTANGHKTISIGPAIDGTRCAVGKICQGGQCITLRGGTMPDQLGMNALWQCAEESTRHQSCMQRRI